MPSLSEIPGEIVAFTARMLLRLFFRAKLVGKLPKADRMLIISNHQSFVDGVVIGAFLPISPTISSIQRLRIAGTLRCR